jgi:thiamine pyrophosphate-dependent acetolactate synthase large subunit-like protein
MGTAGDGERSEISASQIIPNFAYARFGEMLGFKGIFVYKPRDLHGAWQQALSSDRPIVLEVSRPFRRTSR